jgi:hypothetical protein
MPFLDFLFGGGDDSTSVKVPKWLNQAGKGAVNLGQQLATRPYTPYSFQRIANFSDDQKDAMGMLRRGASQVSMRADPLSRMKKFNPLENPKNIDTVRLIDRIPGGKGGGINDYMNPYINQVLDRTDKRIQDAADYQRTWQSNAEANMAGAFGDARHGVADSLIAKEAIQQSKDAAAQGYAEAYNNAQQLRDADINRWLDTQQQNLANDLDAKKYNNAGYLDWESLNTQRQFGQQGADSQAQSDFLRFVDSLYRSGGQQQDLSQKNMDLMYQDFQNQRDYPLQQYDLLLRALNGTPSSNNRITTNNDGGSWFNDILSSALGVGSLIAG